MARPGTAATAAALVAWLCLAWGRAANSAPSGIDRTVATDVELLDALRSGHSDIVLTQHISLGYVWKSLEEPIVLERNVSIRGDRPFVGLQERDTAVRMLDFNQVRVCDGGGEGGRGKGGEKREVAWGR